MTAKKVTEWVVTARHSTKALAEECIRQSGGVCNLDEYVHYICPHCDKPWPRRETDIPLTSLEYKRELVAASKGYVTYGGIHDYCCTATAEDCEDA